MKTIVIHGANSSMGKAIYEHLSNDKNNYFILISRSNIQYNEKNAEHWMFDSQYSDLLKVCLKDIKKKHKKIDVLINTIGYLDVKTIEEETELNFDYNIKVNLKSYWMFINGLIPAMKNGGYIINISSMQGIRSFGGKSSYALCKAAINSLTDSINKEYNKFNIKATAICPGFVDTKMVKNIKNPNDSILPVSDIVKTVYYLLSLSSVAVIDKICLERKSQ